MDEKEMDVSVAALVVGKSRKKVPAELIQERNNCTYAVNMKIRDMGVVR